MKLNYNFNLKRIKIIKWGLGIGDWGLGVGDLAPSPIPEPPTPNPKPQDPLKYFNFFLI